MKNNLFIVTATIFLSTSLFAQENQIPENGNVGIGTTEPTEKLDVRGGAKIDSTLTVGDSVIISNSARVGEDLRVNGNAYVEGDLNLNGGLILPNGPATFSYLLGTEITEPEVLMLDESGRIKRGGSVKSLVYAEASQSLPCLTDINGNIIHSSPFWQHGPQNMFILNNNCLPDVKLGVGVVPTAKFHIKTSSNQNTLPILVEKPVQGSQTPYKLMQLDNTGLLYAREVKVNLDVNWPDYVFEENYDLLPLEDVKAYINQNNHLPNVPSAQEMMQNGVNVSETSVMLMEKVEENMLYIIQLQEQLLALQKMIAEQNALIEAQQKMLLEIQGSTNK